jgi:hypothetical protein
MLLNVIMIMIVILTTGVIKEVQTQQHGDVKLAQTHFLTMLMLILKKYMKVMIQNI